jgi:hypothetical protein
VEAEIFRDPVCFFRGRVIGREHGRGDQSEQRGQDRARQEGWNFDGGVPRVAC